MLWGMSSASSLRTQGSGYVSYLTGSPANASGRLQGGAVLMGGGDDVDEAFRFLVERGGGGDVVILRASGEDGYNQYLMDLCQPDSVETLVFEHRQAAYDPAVVEKIDQAESIFLAGGDQSLYYQYWKDTPLQEALQRAVDRGVPLGGTSAGLAVLGDPSFAAHGGSLTSQEVLAQPQDRRITLEAPLVRLPGVEHLLTDTHFTQRDRLGRLCGFLARSPAPAATLGLGVDEATAVLVEPNGKARVVGQNQAILVQPPGAPEVCQSGQPLTYRNLQIWQVSAGQPISLSRPEGSGSRLDIEAGSLKIFPQ